MATPRVRINELEDMPSPRSYQVAIMGAEVGGIGAACTLKNRGFDQFRIVERECGLGGEDVS
jgi:cation diffusion facilitator CzcD-associated flavoprotein CzcO